MKKIGFKDGGFLNGWNPYLIVSVFSFLLYGNTIFNKYNLDDEMVTSVSASKLHRLTSKGIAAIPEIFKSNYYEDTQGYSYEYRPVVLTTFAIEHSLFGDNPHVGHFINVLLYSLLCALLLLVLNLLLKDYSRLLPFLITLFFAAFPLHTEVVASLKNRDEILALTGGLASLFFFIHYVDRRNLLFLLGGALCFLAGMLSKQTIISFAIIIPLLLFLFREVSIAKAITISILLCAVIFPLIQRTFLVDRIGIIAGVMSFSAVFYEIRYQTFFKKIKFSKNFFLFWKGIPTKAKTPPRVRQLKVSLLSAPIVFIASLIGLVVLTALTLALGSSFYLLPLSMLIPLFLFSPLKGWSYFFPWASAAIAIYIASLFSQSDVFNAFFLLYIFTFLRKNEIKPLEALSCILIALTMAYFDKETGGMQGLEFSKVIWNLILLGGIAGMILMPSRKILFASIPFLFSAMTTFSELLFHTENFMNVYFMGIYFLIIFLILYFPQRTKTITLLATVFIFSSTLMYHEYASNHAKFVKEELFHLNIRLSYQFKEELHQYKEELHQFKGTLTETTHEVVTYKYVNPIQGVGEEDAYRPVEYVESVVGSESSMSEKLGTGMMVTGNYLRLTLIPYPMSFYYGYKCIDKTEISKPVALFILSIVLALIMLALWSVNKNRLLSAGLLIYFITLLPLANIIAPVSGMMADRYLFIPSIGFCILLAVALCRLAKYSVEKDSIVSFFSLPRYFKYPAFAILVFYSGVTIARNSQWHDYLKLMRQDIRHLEESAQAQNLLATHLVQSALLQTNALTRKTLLEEAELHYEKAVNIYSEFFNAQYDLGRVRMMLGKPDKAEKHFLQVIKIDSTFSEPFYQVGLIKAGRGDYREALPYYHKYLKVNPANLDALMNLSFCYARLQDFPRALIPMKKAAAFYPQQPEPFIFLSRIYADLGRIDSAMFYLQRAETIAPNHPDVNLLKNALFQTTPAGVK